MWDEEADQYAGQSLREWNLMQAAVWQTLASQHIVRLDDMEAFMLFGELFSTYYRTHYSAPPLSLLTDKLCCVD